jgi:hypothetical protein
MCTVSVVPREDGFRVVCNRDERRSRPLAIPPRWATIGSVGVTCPVDPQGGGTWVAANSDGMAVALLNRQTRCPPCLGHTVQGQARHRLDSVATPLRSRGEIPLALIDAAGIAEAGERLARIDPTSYSGFLLLVLSFHDLLLAASDGVRLTIDVHRLDRPVAFTSSSLGDHLAERARLPLFRSLVVESRDPWSGQRAFHDHRWAGRRELSVVMRRPDACTVSRTRVDVRRGRVAMDYEPLGGWP